MRLMAMEMETGRRAVDSGGRVRPNSARSQKHPHLYLPVMIAGQVTGDK
jgi:hypothetical protein